MDTTRIKQIKKGTTAIWAIGSVLYMLPLAVELQYWGFVDKLAAAFMIVGMVGSITASLCEQK